MPIIELQLKGLFQRLRRPKKGMFILRLGDGPSSEEEWTAHGEICLPVRPGMSSSHRPLRPETVGAERMEEGRQECTTPSHSVNLGTDKDRN